MKSDFNSALWKSDFNSFLGITFAFRKSPGLSPGQPVALRPRSACEMVFLIKSGLLKKVKGVAIFDLFQNYIIFDCTVSLGGIEMENYGGLALRERN
ncbi:MAG: hypothetical protein A3G49_01300 [Candidatus Sungbacteria bacterium RIFCSPLOWO2_12_FULL_41_11]|uniref:Uncharacterized protein n=1 Tax=Candidatus Sungbacteria bacterium RIFCSPLOWO2_12_FULL_41_11 TaxID=1802286 RepID=A0A1G2LNS1_9BACT|nr:MAG: hypothetical protein A3G49_01300 [Candidatus Sungbacteria bacterium RIFCSPLOWO2_12_FULL_41_11]